jgi:hypothetical protein
MSALGFLVSDAFVGIPQKLRLQPSLQREHLTTTHVIAKQLRQEFLESLDFPYEPNAHNSLRTDLLQKLIDGGTTPEGTCLPNPGSVDTFSVVAPGTWRVVYAPHMTIAAGLLQVS